MGRGTWYEIRFRYKKLEFIATRGNTNINFDSFLGVAVPSCIAQESAFCTYQSARGQTLHQNALQSQEECKS